MCAIVTHVIKEFIELLNLVVTSVVQFHEIGDLSKQRKKKGKHFCSDTLHDPKESFWWRM